MIKYFFHDGETQSGPFTIRELHEGSLSEKTYVWYDGLSNWVSINELEDLKPYIKPKDATPPPFQIATENKTIEDLNEDIPTANVLQTPPSFNVGNSDDNKIVDKVSEQAKVKTRKFYSSNAYIFSILFANPLALGIFHSHNLKDAGEKEYKNPLNLGIVLIVIELILVFIFNSAEEYNTLSSLIGVVNFIACILISNKGIKELREKHGIEIRPKKNPLLHYINSSRWIIITIACFLGFIGFMIVGIGMFSSDSNLSFAKNSPANSQPAFDTSLMLQRIDSIKTYAASGDSIIELIGNESGKKLINHLQYMISNSELILAVNERIMNMDNIASIDYNLRQKIDKYFKLRIQLYKLGIKSMEEYSHRYDKEIDSINNEIALVAKDITQHSKSN